LVVMIVFVHNWSKRSATHTTIAVTGITESLNGERDLNVDLIYT
jgi:hypothetical protein